MVVDAQGSDRQRILLGQLNSLGDCLLATTVARQIKQDFPGCHLTWAIGSMCRTVLEGNPHVDEVWEWPLVSIDAVPDTWVRFEREAHRALAEGRFTRLFLTQISPVNLHHYDGNIRGSLFRAYPGRITVPLEPVLRLSAAEVDRVRDFAKTHSLDEFRQVVLVECAPQSGQSPLTPDIAVRMAAEMTGEFEDSVFLLSSSQAIAGCNERVVDASCLTFRENAELARYCSLLIGGSSGISWLCTSEWVDALPMVQVLSKKPVWSNSLQLDFETWNLPTGQLIEIHGDDAGRVTECVSGVLRDGFARTRAMYQDRHSPNFRAFSRILADLLRQGEWGKAVQLLRINVRRKDFRLFRFLGACITAIFLLMRNLGKA